MVEAAPTEAQAGFPGTQPSSGNAAAKKPAAGKAQAGKANATSHLSSQALEERFAKHKQAFLEKLEALFAIAKPLHAAEARERLALSPPAAVKGLAKKAGESYEAMATAKQRLEERSVNQLIRSQQDMIHYMLGGLDPRKLEDVRRLMADGASPEQLVATLLGASGAGHEAPDPGVGPGPATAGPPASQAGTAAKPRGFFGKS